MADLVLWGMVAVMLGFVFLVYLFFRRTATALKEGMNEGKGKR
ncbi:hypothetical protein ACOZ4N_13475 [Halorientalis pallida]|jgi:hypothetical protein|uniref:Uncharacterized protein n=1 Tax=Halorientalis regularis TaxID=660518 RepID=A0A1G7KF66_9EURY|nr:hypothetical protein [Halorientalis regularis]SDF35832.1 hypothetical protein SAMN05216218_105279 [Halorientalis regularis]